METQNRDNFLWRPNDYSATTRARYDLEAQHWLTSLNSASYNKPSSSGLGVIGLIISFALNILILSIIYVGKLFKWVNKPKELTFGEGYGHLNNKDAEITDEFLKEVEEDWADYEKNGDNWKEISFQDLK